MRKIHLALLMMGILASCQAPTESRPFALESQEFVLEGPLFEGANMAQIEVSPAVMAAIEAEGFGQLKGVRLTGATLRVADSLSFDMCQEMALQAVGDAVEMQQIAVLNPVPAGQSSVDLQPAAEAELLPHFKAGTFYLVLDVNLATDRDEDLPIEASLQFELKVAQ